MDSINLENDPYGSEILILAPIGNDSSMAAQVLNDAGFNASSVYDLGALCRRVKDSTGVIVITEEVLNEENASLLKDALARQPAWSNVPVVLLTSEREKVFATQQVLDFFSFSGGFSVLERPFKIVTLITAMRVALLSRARQIQARDLLASKDAAVAKQLAAIKQRDDFFSIASHELKTPITSLKLQVQLRKRAILKGDQSALSIEKVNAFLDKTETSLDRVVRLVDDMLDVSKFENGKLALNRETFDLTDLVSEVFEQCSAQFISAECVVELNLEKNLFGQWDRFRLEQVFTNIFTNAIKYGRGRPVTIVSCRNPQGATVSVSDQGMGISADNQSRIFDRFERAVSNESISGLGLGLYIAKEIINLHGGLIEVQSEVGRGSKFTVHLPIVP